MPAWSAVLPALVGRQNLAGAISLNSTQVNLSRVIGPAIAGVAVPDHRPGVDLRDQRRHLPVRRRRAALRAPARGAEVGRVGAGAAS